MAADQRKMVHGILTPMTLVRRRLSDTDYLIPICLSIKFESRFGSTNTFKTAADQRKMVRGIFSSADFSQAEII